MFGFLRLSAVWMVMLFPIFIWIGFEQGNAPPEKFYPHPKTVDDWVNRGLLYEKHRDYQSAFQDYEQAIALDPTNQSGYISQGMLLVHQMGQKEKGIERYRQAKAVAQAKHNQREVQHAEWFIQQAQNR